MPYTLTELSKDVRAVLRRASAVESIAELCALVGKVLGDQEFIEMHLPDRTDGQLPRQILYEDPEFGFCICGHVYAGEAAGEPHDHGPGWALYGQVSGTTEITDWKVVEDGTDGGPKRVIPERTYQLNPGDTHFYDIGMVHSPKRTAPARLIRIESENLDNVKRTNIRALLT